MIFTEGESSEPTYLDGLRSVPSVRSRTAVNLEISRHHGVPLTLVRNAIERQRDPEVDECWCVFDVEWPENHADLDEALRRARKHGIGVAMSNPCFELWLILHYQDHRKFLETKEACRLSRQLDGRSGKSVDVSLYLPYRHEASARAAALAEAHVRDERTFPYDNPSTSMHDLLAALEPDTT